MSGPKEETKELRRQVKRSVRLDRRQMWEDATVSLEKAASSRYPQVLPDPERVRW